MFIQYKRGIFYITIIKFLIYNIQIIQIIIAICIMFNAFLLWFSQPYPQLTTLPLIFPLKNL